MAKLGEVCEILDSKRIPITASNRQAGSYPYYGANGVQDYINDYIFDDELVLLAEDGGNFGSKDKPIAYRVSGKCWVNNHAHVLKPKQGLNVDYLCYSLMFYDVSTLVNGATRKKLTQADMRKIEIPLPPLEEQEKIAIVLDKVTDLIDKRKQQLAKLDELIKSRFVEMFGDPVINPKHFLTLKWNNVFNTATGKLDSNLAVENGKYPFFTCAKQALRIDDYAFNQEALLLAGNNAQGKYDVKYYNGKFNAYQRTYVLTLKENWKYPLFKYQLENKLEQLEKQSLGGLTKYLTLQILNQLEFIVPPLDLQNQFAEFVEQTEKIKVAINHSLDKLETLKKALMQKYFG